MLARAREHFDEVVDDATHHRETHDEEDPPVRTACFQDVKRKAELDQYNDSPNDRHLASQSVCCRRYLTPAKRQRQFRPGVLCALVPGDVHDHAGEEVKARLDGAQVDEFGVARMRAEALQAEALEDRSLRLEGG